MTYYIVNGSIRNPEEPDKWHLFNEPVSARDEAAAVDKALVLAACNAGLDDNVAEWVSEPEVDEAPADIINRIVGAARFPGW